MQTQSSQELLTQERYGAIVRSISGDAQVNLRDWLFYRDDDIIGQLAPHLNPVHFSEAWANHRGILDGLGLRLALSNRTLHQAKQPHDLVGSLVFEVLEQIRVESICPASMVGAKENLRLHFIAWLNQFMASGNTEGSIGLLLLAIFGGTWSRMNNAPLPQLMQDTIEIPRAELYLTTGTLLEKLKRLRYDQEHYSEVALELANFVSDLVQKEYENVPSIRIKRKNLNQTRLPIVWEFSDKQRHPIAANSLFSNSHTSEELKYQHELKRYRVFDRSYDQEMKPLDTIRLAQLVSFREEMDQQIQSWSIPWSRLIKVYTPLFCNPNASGVESAEEGVLNRKLLSRIVTSINPSSVYQTAYLKPKPTASVTFLIDCSGSMKEHRVIMASWIDVMVKILDKIGVPTEVLGYSTMSWQGGRCFKQWQLAGKPDNPGRLNERAHWVFKDFNSSWRQARLGLAAMLKPDIYRESLDGEALQWAISRSNQESSKQMATSSEPIQQNIVLLSDGCPMDRATQQANDENYLIDHLKLVLKWSECQANTRIWGCGVGQEMRGFFRRKLSWNKDDSVVQSILAWADEFKRQR